MKNHGTLFLAVIIFVLFDLSCYHPLYKRLARHHWEKDTTWVRYPDLPAPVLETVKKYYEASFTKDTTDDLPDLISLDSTQRFSDMGFYDAYSHPFRMPFGWYFKIGKRKCFIDYSEATSPLIYYEGYLFFDSKEYYDKSIKEKLYDKYERRPYDKKYYVRYKLK